MKTFTPYSSSDYNGFGLNPVAGNFAWDGPPFDGANGGRVHKTYDTLADYQRAAARTSQHDCRPGRLRQCQADRRSDPRKLYEPEKWTSGCGPIPLPSTRAWLPTITDGFKGRAPDLGAIEFGSAPPHYGPEIWPVGAAPSALRSETGPPREP